jgi:hypothetical protein
LIKYTCIWSNSIWQKIDTQTILSINIDIYKLKLHKRSINQIIHNVHINKKNGHINVFGYVLFIVKYTRDLPDFSTMKSIFLFIYAEYLGYDSLSCALPQLANFGSIATCPCLLFASSYVMVSSIHMLSPTHNRNHS